MGERPRRTMYYIDGSTVRKVEQAPSRKSNNEVHKKSSNKQAQQRRVSEKAQNALAFNMGYTQLLLSWPMFKGTLSELSIFLS